MRHSPSHWKAHKCLQWQPEPTKESSQLPLSSSTTHKRKLIIALQCHLQPTKESSQLPSMSSTNHTRKITNFAFKVLHNPQKKAHKILPSMSSPTHKGNLLAEYQRPLHIQQLPTQQLKNQLYYCCKVENIARTIIASTSKFQDRIYCWWELFFSQCPLLWLREVQNWEPHVGLREESQDICSKRVIQQMHSHNAFLIFFNSKTKTLAIHLGSKRICQQRISARHNFPDESY